MTPAHVLALWSFVGIVVSAAALVVGSRCDGLGSYRRRER